MTVQEFQAKRIERIAEALAHFVKTTPEDKLDWCPAACAESQTRSILAQIGECVKVNRAIAAILRGETVDYYGSPAVEFTSGEEAQRQIVESGQELASVIRKLDDAGLDRTFPHWRGTFRGEIMLEAPYRNMAYHAGQINYIQCLAGDSEFHMPPTWT